MVFSTYEFDTALTLVCHLVLLRYFSLFVTLAS